MQLAIGGCKKNNKKTTKQNKKQNKKTNKHFSSKNVIKKQI